MEDVSTSPQLCTHPLSPLPSSRCEKIVSRFMELDIENDDLVAFLKDFVLPTAKGIL